MNVTKEVKQRIAIVVNPVSGTSSKEASANEAAMRLRSLGHEVEVLYTGAPGDATRLAREAVNRGAGLVIAVGGDGTVNETAKALCNSNVSLGIIPMGSGNGLARHLGIPVDFEGALNVITDGNVKAIDYCTMNGEDFFCTFGVGFDAAVTHTFAKQSGRGLVTYLKSALMEFLKFHSAEYTINAGGKVLTEKAFLVAVCNTSQYGNNAYIAPEARIDDGYVDVTIVHAGNHIAQALVGVDLFTGLINKNILIETMRVPSVSIRCNTTGSMAAHIDGEPRQLEDRAEIVCRHNGLRVVAPIQSESFTPIITPMSNIVRETRIALKNLFHPWAIRR